MKKEVVTLTSWLKGTVGRKAAQSGREVAEGEKFAYVRHTCRYWFTKAEWGGVSLPCWHQFVQPAFLRLVEQPHSSMAQQPPTQPGKGHCLSSKNASASTSSHGKGPVQLENTALAACTISSECATLPMSLHKEQDLILHLFHVCSSWRLVCRLILKLQACFPCKREKQLENLCTLCT